MMIASTRTTVPRTGTELVNRIVDELIESHVRLEEVTLDEMKARVTDALRNRRAFRERNRLTAACCCDPTLHG